MLENDDATIPLGPKDIQPWFVASSLSIKINILSFNINVINIYHINVINIYRINLDQPILLSFNIKCHQYQYLSMFLMFCIFIGLQKEDLREDQDQLWFHHNVIRVSVFFALLGGFWWVINCIVIVIQYFVYFVYVDCFIDCCCCIYIITTKYLYLLYLPSPP